MRWQIMSTMTLSSPTVMMSDVIALLHAPTVMMSDVIALLHATLNCEASSLQFCIVTSF